MMDIEELKAAFADGKKIQARVKGSNDLWIVAAHPNWNTDEFEYRLSQRLLEPVAKPANDRYWSALF